MDKEGPRQDKLWEIWEELGENRRPRRFMLHFNATTVRFNYLGTLCRTSGSCGMAKRIAKRSERTLTDEERARMREIRAQVELDLPELMAKGRALKAAHRQSRSLLEQLKALRVAQGLSLQQMQDRTGIGRAALSKLERAEHANPTLATLSRYASALGKDLAIELVDRN